MNNPHLMSMNMSNVNNNDNINGPFAPSLPPLPQPLVPAPGSMPSSSGAPYAYPVPETEDERRALAMLKDLGFGSSGHGYLLLLRAYQGNLQHVVNHLVKQQAFPYQ
jgi:hypothetical protein